MDANDFFNGMLVEFSYSRAGFDRRIVAKVTDAKLEAVDGRGTAYTLDINECRPADTQAQKDYWFDRVQALEDKVHDLTTQLNRERAKR